MTISVELAALGLTMLSPVYYYGYRLMLGVSEIKTQLRACKHCRESYKKLYGDEISNVV